MWFLCKFTAKIKLGNPHEPTILMIFKVEMHSSKGGCNNSLHQMWINKIWFVNSAAPHAKRHYWNASLKASTRSLSPIQDMICWYWSSAIWWLQYMYVTVKPSVWMDAKHLYPKTHLPNGGVSRFQRYDVSNLKLYVSSSTVDQVLWFMINSTISKTVGIWYHHRFESLERSTAH